ncbi:MAG TPA: ThiF family adenylyltransferase [Micromonosporaceae bacterium]
MHPRLKDVFWRRRGADLTLVYGDRELLRIDDRNGTIELVLDLMRAGSRTSAELAFTAGAPLIAVEQLIETLDLHRLLVDDDYGGRFDAFDRHGEARSFFVPHATMQVAVHDMLERVHAAHILLLGANDVNLEVASQLARLGVGHLTVADPRSYATVNGTPYPRVVRGSPDEGDGRRVATRVSAIDPSVQTIDVREPIADATALGKLFGRDRPDVLVADLGVAASAAPWLNACCVTQGVPFTAASVGHAGALVYSVDPGRSACVACVTSASTGTQDVRAIRAAHERPIAGHFIPPISGTLASLLVLEVLRYITGYEPPAYAGQPICVDMTAGGAMHRLTWRRNETCAVCREATVGGVESAHARRAQPM